MTRKDYIKTANILSSFKDEIHPEVYQDMIDLFGNYFASDNEKFDKEKFENACGIDELELV